MVNHLWGQLSERAIRAAATDLRLKPVESLPMCWAELLSIGITKPLGRFDVLTHIGRRPELHYLTVLAEEGVRFIDVLAEDTDARHAHRARANTVCYYDKDQKPQLCWLYLSRGELTEGNFSRAVREGIHRVAGKFPEDTNTHFCDLSGLTHAK